VDQNLVAALMAEFGPMARTLVSELEKAQAGHDFKGLELNSHSLKSSAKVLGMDQLADLCLRIELAAGENKTDPAAVKELSKALSESITAIEAHIARRAA
jgi:HPt (histidine-containing phosphotransfer) domain-containing protein